MGMRAFSAKRCRSAPALRLDHAVTAQNDGALALVDQSECPAVLIALGRRRVVKARQIGFVGGRVEVVVGRHFLYLDILGNIHHHGSAPAGEGDIDRLVQRLFDLGRRKRHIGLFGQRHHHPHHVTLLESVRGDDARADLSGHGQHRHRIHHSVSDAGDKIHGTGARGRHTNADLGSRSGDRCPRQPLGHEGGPLLVAGHHESKTLLALHLVEDRHDGTARVAKHILYAFIPERLQDQLFACDHGISSFISIPVKLRVDARCVCASSLLSFVPGRRVMGGSIIIVWPMTSPTTLDRRLRLARSAGLTYTIHVLMLCHLRPP